MLSSMEKVAVSGQAAEQVLIIGCDVNQRIKPQMTKLVLIGQPSPFEESVPAIFSLEFESESLRRSHTNE